MTSAIWHREEPREVRPFFQSRNAENALDGGTIRLFDGTEFSSENSFDLDDIDFKKLSISVRHNLSGMEAWIPDNLEPDDLELVLIARHAVLKRSAVVHSTVLGVDLPVEWKIDEAILDRYGGGRNLELTLAICLRTDREPIPGAPFVAGHWLGRKTFSLRSRTMPTLFDLRTRKDEDWVAKGFPAKTFYAVEYIGGIDSEVEEGSSVATVWIHVDAHNRMVSTSIGETLQPLLASEIIASILLESFDEWRNAPTIEPLSPLSTLLKQLGKEKSLDLAGLKALVANPPLLKATLQDRLSVLSALR